MLFDPENPINKLCAEGMMAEGEADPEKAAKLFQQAWNEATDAVEKLTAAHYCARHQRSVADKLKWDETALHFALSVPGEEIKAIYPSLYLNIAKCHEDMKDFVKALENYQLASNFTTCLPDDGFGNMLKAGIANGLERLQPNLN
jgi:tetratricopeptide (TPR) repeat protein